jgi:hypothetical protein
MPAVGIPETVGLAFCRYSFLNPAYCHADLAVFGQMVPTGPTAAAQNSVQNTLQNAPLALQEAPERLLIALSLIAVAVGGYLLRDKVQKK